jgi:hypothetical protein
MGPHLTFLVVAFVGLTIAQQLQFGDLHGDSWQGQTREEKLNQMINHQYQNLGKGLLTNDQHQDTADFPGLPGDPDIPSYEFIVQPIFETQSGTLYSNVVTHSQTISLCSILLEVETLGSRSLRKQLKEL